MPHSYKNPVNQQPINQQRDIDTLAFSEVNPITSLNIPIPAKIVLKKGEERRLRTGHLWIYSNEINTKNSPLSDIKGSLVHIYDYSNQFIATASFNAHSLIAARIVSFKPLLELDQDFFVQKISQAQQLRSTFFALPYYRLIFGEGDYLSGLVIDRFNNTFVVQTSTQLMDSHLPTITNALKQLYGEQISILIKNDSKGRQIENLPLEVTKLGTDFDDLQIIENDVAFTAPLTGQKTGWFYDHRLGRQWLNQISKDKTVLDLFSYIGGWGVQAAHHGAKAVTCVDISADAGEFVKQNAAQNQLSQVQFVEANVFDWLKKPVDSHYDVVVLDPPALIQKKRDYAQGRQAYFSLNEAALKRVNDQGILITASCSLHLPSSELQKIVEQAAGRLNYQVQLIHQTQAGMDHPQPVAMSDTAYLKCLMFKVTKQV